MAQSGTKHSTEEMLDDDFEHDLHPNQDAGVHAGSHEHTHRTAYDIKELHALLSGFQNDELHQIPIERDGSRLEQGAVYLDIAAPSQKPFIASGDSVAEPGAYYVPKSETDYLLWNRLTGTTVAERLDQQRETERA